MAGDEYNRESLVTQLREQGVTYLAPSDGVISGDPLPMEALVSAVLRQADTRLHLALIPLFLRNPALANCVADLVEELEPATARELQTLYMAAVYLQRHWRSRLGFYLNANELLPDLFSETLGLPAADERFGKLGLHTLADQWQVRSPYPFDRLADLNRTMELFFEELKLEGMEDRYARASGPAED